MGFQAGLFGKKTLPGGTVLGALQGRIRKQLGIHQSKGMDATKGQAPMGIARNGNIQGALQSTQGQRSYLTGAGSPIGRPGGAGQKSLLGA